MGAPKLADWREGRRKRARALKQEGWPRKHIAAALGVGEGAVGQWLKRARDGGGVAALAHRPPPGMTPRLSAERRARPPPVPSWGGPPPWLTRHVLAATRPAPDRTRRSPPPSTPRAERS